MIEEQQMTTVHTTTFPGTQFDLEVESVQTGARATFFDVTATAVTSGVVSCPKRYKDLDEFAADIADIGLDGESIGQMKKSVEESGSAMVSDVWLLDAQAAKFRVHIER